MRVLTFSCTIYDFCERNFLRDLWDLRELLLLLSSCAPAAGSGRFYWSLPQLGSTQLREFFQDGQLNGEALTTI